jgi:hypothetical protein
VQNDQRATQRNSRRQQAGKEAREIFQIARGDFVAAKLEREPAAFRRGGGVVFGRLYCGPFRERDRPAASSWPCVTPPSSCNAL